MTQDPADRLGLAIKRAELVLIAAKTHALRPLGLTVPQYSALLFLAHEPGLSAAAMGRRALVTPQSMGPVLSGLEDRGFVERQRHRHHRRLLEHFLTPGGRTRLRQANRVAQVVEDQVAAGLSTADQQRLRELLDTATANLHDPASVTLQT